MTASPRSRLRWPRLVLRLASPLVPGGLRHDWRREWNAELTHTAEESRATTATLVRRSPGALVDAAWLRQRAIADFDWIDDLRHGWRQLRDHAGFAITATGILALGIAATVTMFSVIDQVLMRPLPYPDPDRIVTLWETRADSPELLKAAPANFLDWRDARPRSSTWQRPIRGVWTSRVDRGPRSSHRRKSRQASSPAPPHSTSS